MCRIPFWQYPHHQKRCVRAFLPERPTPHPVFNIPLGSNSSPHIPFSTSPSGRISRLQDTPETPFGSSGPHPFLESILFLFMDTPKRRAVTDASARSRRCHHRSRPPVVLHGTRVSLVGHPNHLRFMPRCVGLLLHEPWVSPVHDHDEIDPWGGRTGPCWRSCRGHHGAPSVARFAPLRVGPRR